MQGSPLTTDRRSDHDDRWLLCPGRNRLADESASGAFPSESRWQTPLLHFYTDNCSWCERLEEGSFRAPQVGEAVQKDFVPVKVHASRNPKLTEMFKVTKFPTDVIVSTNGDVLSHSVSPQLPDKFVAMLTGAIPSSTSAAPKIVANTMPATDSAADNLPAYAKAPQPTAPTGKPQPGASVASSSKTEVSRPTLPTASRFPAQGFLVNWPVPVTRVCRWECRRRLTRRATIRLPRLPRSRRLDRFRVKKRC